MGWSRPGGSPTPTAAVVPELALGLKLTGAIFKWRGHSEDELLRCGFPALGSLQLPKAPKRDDRLPIKTDSPLARLFTSRNLVSNLIIYF